MKRDILTALKATDCHSMKRIVPDFAWYLAESTRLGLKSPRCPFASVHGCPRYYQSLSLLGNAGCTSIQKDVGDELKARWKKHPLWPATGDQATAISGGNDGPNGYHNFCPEVAYDTFKLFATYLGRHVGEIDRDIAAEQLAKEGASYDDPRWTWCSVVPQHYIECPLYSGLSHGSPNQITPGMENIQGTQARPMHTAPTPTATNSVPHRRFRVALSFPGEQRSYIEKVAALLECVHGRDKILYDRFHEAEFARPDLDVYLPNLYRTSSDLICIFLCSDYSRKRFCNLEWRFIRQLIATEDHARIMFLSFDAIAAIPEIGILNGDGYVSIGTRSAIEISMLIDQRLAL